MKKNTLKIDFRRQITFFFKFNLYLIATVLTFYPLLVMINFFGHILKCFLIFLKFESLSIFIGDATDLFILPYLKYVVFSFLLPFIAHYYQMSLYCFCFFRMRKLKLKEKKNGKNLSFLLKKKSNSRNLLFHLMLILRS